MPFFCTGFLLRKQSRFLQNDSRASGRQIAETILLVLLLAAYTYGMTAFKPPFATGQTGGLALNLKF